MPQLPPVSRSRGAIASRSRGETGLRPCRVLSALLLGLMLGSCRSEPSWISNRWSDWSEVLDLDAGFAAGLHAHLGVSHLFAVGAGSYEGPRVGVRGGETGLFDERRSEFSVGPFQLHEMEAWPDSRWSILELRAAEFSEPGFREGSYLPWEALVTDRDPLDLSLEANALLGVRVRLKTGQLLDAVAGLFTLDPAGDDLHALDEVERERLDRQLRSRDAGDRERAIRKLRRLGFRPAPGDPDYFVYADPEVRPVEQERAADAYARALRAHLAESEEER